ncbi:hypothetical protein HDU85_002570 [Gaertneriomyces sp. JEL0708]|nr:hypothetical protein HDU85_002570 [Gaertneriomyces sp. JEL0708]
MSIVKKRKISEAEDDNVSVKSDATTVSASDDEATVSSGKRKRPNTLAGQTVTMTSITSSTTVSTTNATPVTKVTITESSSHCETTTTTLSDPVQPAPAPAPAPQIHPFFTKAGFGTTAAGGSSTHTSPFTKVKWSKHGSVLVGTYGVQTANTRIAAFDFDGTIAGVRGKHVYPKNGDDWRFFHPSIPSRLVTLSAEEGFRIVIMSNQKNIEKDKHRKAAFMGRVENVVRAIERHAEKEGIEAPSILVFGAVEDDWCRKPRPGMWELLETEFNEGVSVDKEHSFYVGDAAGRPQDHMPGTKRDFADTDYKFALNVKCQFYTPEGFFHFKTLDQAVPAHKAQHPSHAPPDPPFDPKEYLQKLRTTTGDTDTPSPSSHTSPSSTKHLSIDVPPPPPPSAARHPEIVILVGLPASGKSHFALHKLVPNGYTRVNQDLLKTRDKCLKAAEHALMNNPHASVVVDNTNPDKATRKVYVEMARRVGARLGVRVGVRCFEFVTPEEVCLHNNAYRSLVGRPPRGGSGGGGGNGETTNGTNKQAPTASTSITHSEEPYRDRVPRMAYQQFHTRYQKPDVSEGFDEVVTVEFAAEFRNEEEEEVWQMYFV